jgi:hypothetical protein
MLKTISAALLAVSVLAAPAMAASSDKTTQVPVAKQAPVAKTTQVKPGVLNANAKMGNQRKHLRNHRSHKHVGVIKTHNVSKVTTRHVAPASKRG